MQRLTILLLNNSIRPNLVTISTQALVAGQRVTFLSLCHETILIFSLCLEDFCNSYQISVKYYSKGQLFF